MARVLISGWSGSSNLGDELVLAGLLRRLAGHDVAVVSIDPPGTQAAFGVAAVAPREVGRLFRAVRDADLLVFGGGGLLQDSTSPFNLPYHLARPLLAGLVGTPVVGVGLGAGPLDRAGSGAMVRWLRRAVALSVRDQPSRQLLADLGVEARLGADLAFGLSAPAVAPEDVITVSLRPWAGGGGLLPVGLRRRHEAPAGHLDAVVAQLDALSAATGLPLRLVALQADRDDPLHAEVARRLRAPVERVVPDVHHVVEEVGAGRLVVAMRYHAGVAATLTGRPSVLLGYSPKVEALAAELGDGGRLLAWDTSALGQLAAAGEALLASTSAPAAVAAARDRLAARGRVDDEVLAEGLQAADTDA